MWFGGVDLSQELLFTGDRTFVNQIAGLNLRLVEILVEKRNFLCTSSPADYHTKVRWCASEEHLRFFWMNLTKPYI